MSTVGECPMRRFIDTAIEKLQRLGCCLFPSVIEPIHGLVQLDFCSYVRSVYSGGLQLYLILMLGLVMAGDGLCLRDPVLVVRIVSRVSQRLRSWPKTETNGSLPPLPPPY